MLPDADSTTSTSGHGTEPRSSATSKDAGSKATSAKEHKSLEVILLHGRTRHLGWTGFGLVAGIALILKLGVIGQGIGALLILIALLQGYKAVQTFVHPPGTFKITAEQLVLPTGLCRGRDLEVKPADLQHAFLLRRAVPWTMAGPVLVVESKGKAYSYPRDWFASDSDQRRVERALNRGRKSGSAA